MDKSSILLKKFNNKAPELRVPSNTFEGPNVYIIKCELIDASENLTLTKVSLQVVKIQIHFLCLKASQTVKVLERGLIVKLPFKTLVTRLGSPIKIKAYIVGLDNQSGEIRVENIICKINEF